MLKNYRLITTLSFIGLYAALSLTNKSECMNKRNHAVPEIKAVWFDIGSVLLQRDIARMIWHIGPSLIAKYVLFDGRNPLELRKKVYSIIDYMAEREGIAPYVNAPTTEHGHPLSVSMGLWQQGKLTNKQMLLIIKKAIKDLADQNFFLNEREQEIATRIAHIIFDAELMTKTKKKISAITNFVPRIYQQTNADKSRKYKLIIMSNIDKDSVSQVKTIFPDLFGYFDDFIASSKIGLLKPDPAFYEYALKKHNLRPEECILLDDLPENIASAKELGIYGILVDRKNPSLAKAQLEKLDIL